MSAHHVWVWGPRAPEQQIWHEPFVGGAVVVLTKERHKLLAGPTRLTEVEARKSFAELAIAYPAPAQGGGDA